MQLTIPHHSEILRFLETPGKYECRQLREIWKSYTGLAHYDTECFCDRDGRGKFLEEFKAWFAQMEQNLGND